MRKILEIIKKRTVKDAGIVYVGAIINNIALFALNILLIRILPQEQYGIFAISLVVLSAATDLSDLGLNGGLLRFAPYYAGQNFQKLKQLVKTIFLWRIWIAAIITILGFASADLIASLILNQPLIANYLKLSFLGIGGVVFSSFTIIYLQATQKFIEASVFNSLKGLLRLVVIGILFLAGTKDLYLVMTFYLLIPWLLFLISYHYLPEKFLAAEISKNEQAQMKRSLTKFSFWLTIGTFFTIASSRIDQIMISNFLNLEDVAKYSAAMQLMVVYMIAAQAITTVLGPKINVLTDKQEIISFAMRIFRWIIPLFLGLVILIYPSKFIFILLFGENYLNSVPVYLILSYSFALGLLSIPFSLVITAFSKTNYIAYFGFIQLAANFILNFIFIPKYGIIGASLTFAIGIILSLLYNLISSLYLFKKAELKIT